VVERARAPLATAFAASDKAARREAIAAARAAVQMELADPQHPESPDPKLIGQLFDEHLSELVREQAIAGRRLDGRGPEDIRPITSEVGWLPSVHGSSLFTRGETQAPVVCTLGSGQDEQEVEDLDGVHRDRFQLYYNFPPYSAARCDARGPGGGIGHGNSSARAGGRAARPAQFLHDPARIEIADHGSSSMATAAAPCLMDAGVPTRARWPGSRWPGMDPRATAALCRPLRHPRRRGPSRRHGLQGRRHPEGITAVQMDNKMGACRGRS
jgi:polyribonucleotide nucleotidyltransferase